jgi:Sperm-tail PG-rich repeat
MGIKKNDKVESSNLGPNTYTIKALNTAPNFSFGSRFESDFRSKDHIRPKKSDEPAPGSYDIKSSVQIYNPSEADLQNKKTTWGKALRDRKGESAKFPSPDKYNPNKHTEATYHYSFPRADKGDITAAAKASFTPGPGTYEIRKEN